MNGGPKWPPWTVTQVPPKDDVMLEEDSKGVNSQGAEQTPRITDLKTKGEEVQSLTKDNEEL